MRIRKALFIYLSITLDKLPAWCDFWQTNGNNSRKAAPALSKNHLTNLEAFDHYYKRELMRAKIHASLLPGSADFESTPDLRDEIQHSIDTARIDRKVRYDTIGEIFKGPRNTEADLEASVKQLSDYYQPKLENIEGLFTMLEESTSDSGPSLSSSQISQAVRSLVLVGRDIRQKVERELRNQPTSGKGKRVCSESLLNETLDFMAAVEWIDRTVWTLFEGVSKRVEDMSE